jgi:hypothetical protein
LNIDEQHHKTLNYVITAILSKISQIRANSNSDLIIDIGTFLSSVKQNIQSLKELEKDQITNQIMNRHKSEFKDEIDQKIKEAGSFIETEIVTAIDDSKIMIDIQIELLLQETVTLQEQAKTETKELEKQKKMFRS